MACTLSCSSRYYSASHSLAAPFPSNANVPTASANVTPPALSAHTRTCRSQVSKERSSFAYLHDYFQCNRPELLVHLQRKKVRERGEQHSGAGECF